MAKEFGEGFEKNVAFECGLSFFPGLVEWSLVQRARRLIW